MPTLSKSDLQAKAQALGLPTAGTKAEISNRITAFDYNAIVDKGRRQAPQTRTKHETKVLPDSKRRKLIATTQDQIRNASLPAWMLRKHLDYTSRFKVDVDIKRVGVKRLVERILQWHAEPNHFDISRRFGREEFFRMFEAEKTVSGDAAFIKLTQDLKIQAVESDLIAMPKAYADGVSSEEQVRIGKIVDKESGLVKNEFGAIEQFCICNRGATGDTITFDHLEDYENVEFDAYYTRFSSQDRGVSPLSTAINTVQDIYEGLEWNIVKAKMHALFGIAIMRSASTEPNFGGASGVQYEVDDDTAVDETGSHLDIRPDSINLLDLNAGETIDTFESGTPSIEFVNAMGLYMQIALLALDIPITCLDSRKSSFSARIADLNEYEVSVDWKQAKNKFKRKAYSDWLLESIWNNTNSRFNLRQVATEAKMTLFDVQQSINWIASGSPWLDKLKQMMGDAMAIDVGADNIIDVCRRRGTDFFDNIDKQSRALKYAKRKEVPIMTGGSGVRSAHEIIAEEEQRENEAAAGIEDEDEDEIETDETDE